MQLTDDYEPIVLLADQDNFTGLADCRLILLDQGEAEEVADKDNLAEVMARPACQARTFNLEDLVRWALTQGYAPRPA